MTSKSKKKRKANSSSINNTYRAKPKPYAPRVVSKTTNNKEQVTTTHPHWFFHLAKLWRQGLVILFTIIAWNIVATLLGFSPFPQSSPLVIFINLNPIVSLVIGGLLLVVSFAALLVRYLPEPQGVSKSWLLPRWVCSTLIPIISFSLFFLLLAAVLIRPVGCPPLICPTSQRILIFHPQSIHDDNLELYFIANQSSYYAIPNNPTHYTQGNLPMSIPALHTDGENSMLLYHLIVGLNSLQRGRFGMVIEEVNLVILKVAPLPHPLNVWSNTLYVHYENENQYRALYLGQQADAIITADYLRFQFGFVQLKPGETDQIDVHVVSRVEANIWFTVQVIYRIANESQLHTLRLPQQFEVMFANKSDWHLYQIR